MALGARLSRLMCGGGYAPPQAPLIVLGLRPLLGHSPDPIEAASGRS